MGEHYVAAALFVYNSHGWEQLNEIIRFPLIEYLLVFGLAGLAALGIWISDRFQSRSSAATELISKK